MDTETTTAAPTTTKSAPPTAVDDAAKTTASPAAQEEYTNRLLSSYELIKAQNAGSISIRHLLDALQTNRELLRTLEECADWSTQSRHECYRELFIALQQEEKDRTAWNKSKIEGKAAMRQAGMKVASEKGGEENHDDDDDDDDDAFRPTGVTFQLLQELLPAAKDNTDGQFSFAPSQPNDNNDAKEGKAQKGQAQKSEEQKSEQKEQQQQQQQQQQNNDSDSVSKLHQFYMYHSTDVERRLSRSGATNILDLNGCGLKRFPDLLPKQLQDLKQITMQRNNIRHLPAEMGYCVRLERLICSNNQLDRLPESVARLPYLLTLDISDNLLQYLPTSIGSLIHLRYLSAANNYLETLPPSLGNLVQLQELNFDGNPKMHHTLQSKYKESLPALLSFLQSLKSCLHLAHEHETHTTSPGSNVYLPSIHDIQHVTEKQVYESDELLKHAEFGTVGRVVDVRRAIFRSRAELCTKICGTPLSLKHVGLLSLTDDVLPSDPAVLKELRSFDVSQNVQLRTLNSFQPILPRMIGLRRLNLASCGLKTLPSSIESGFNGLVSLQALNLSQNNIEDIDKHAFSGGMEQTLQLLDISSNKLEVISGTTISNLVALKTFMYHTNGKGLSEHPKLLAAEEDGNHLTSIIGVLISIEKGFTTHSMKEDIRIQMLKERFSCARQSGILDLSNVLVSKSTISSKASLDASIPNDLLGSTKDLTLCGNNLDTLPKEMALMFRLVRLDVSNNRLTNATLMEKNKNNKNNRSSPNKFPTPNNSSILPSKPIFNALRMLCTLDLSNNKIGPDLPYALVQMAPRLQVLALYNNDIERIDPSFVTSPWQETLKTITLDANPLPNILLNGLKTHGVPGLFAAVVKVDKDQKDANVSLKKKLLAQQKKEALNKAKEEKERKEKIKNQLAGKK